MADLLQATKKRIKSRLPFPLVYGPAFARTWNSLIHSQWYSPDALHELQMAKLQKLVRHAYTHVPYYRQAMRQAGIEPSDAALPDLLSRLPFLEKNTLRERFGDLTADSASQYQPQIQNTSGSTGIPQKLLLDHANHVFENATIWRHNSWAGFRYGQREAILRGKMVPKGEFFYFSSPTTVVLSSFSLQRKTVDHYIQVLRRFRPDVIRAYPSAIYFLARLLEQWGVTDVRPQSIITSSETLLPHQRATVERIFQCPIFDWYGSGERVAIISQCPAGKYHVHLEYGLVEYFERPEFSQGGSPAYEIVCTGLNNFSMPLLRYRIGDIVRIRPGEACDCGRGLPVVSSVEGRVDDVIITPDGRVIPASGMTLAFEFSETIAQAQLFQETIEELIIRIVRTERYSNEDHSFMLSQVRSRIGSEMRIRVDFVDEISRLPSGKQPFAISKIKLEQVL